MGAMTRLIIRKGLQELLWFTSVTLGRLISVKWVFSFNLRLPLTEYKVFGGCGNVECPKTAGFLNILGSAWCRFSLLSFIVLAGTIWWCDASFSLIETLLLSWSFLTSFVIVMFFALFTLSSRFFIQLMAVFILALICEIEIPGSVDVTRRNSLPWLTSSSDS